MQIRRRTRMFQEACSMDFNWLINLRVLENLANRVDASFISQLGILVRQILSQGLSTFCLIHAMRILTNLAYSFQNLIAYDTMRKRIGSSSLLITTISIKNWRELRLNGHSVHTALAFAHSATRTNRTNGIMKRLS